MGDSDARRARFEGIYRRHSGAVAAYALRRAARETAEDVVAETFLVVWRRLDDAPEQLLPWLYGIARRTFANHRRADARRERLASRLRLYFDGEAASPADVRLLDALQSLRFEDRELLMLISWEGLTPTEAAQALGCTPVACRVRLHRARKRLASALEEPRNRPVELRARDAR